jgi:hypothetical protein
MAVLENSIPFSISIFSCSRGEVAGASFPPFLAAFFSSFYMRDKLLSFIRP